VKPLPRITVITPSYNQAQYIEQTIRSVLDQNYPDLEYWVIDGGSTDGTLDILRKYGSRINWTSETDRGQTHAINKGIELSTGEVVAYLNSDDVYEAGALTTAGQFFARHPQAAWVTGKCRIIDQKGQEVRKAITFYKNMWLHLASYTLLLILDYISQPATFWRREVVERVGPFDEALYYTMDYDYSLRVGRHYRLHVIDEYLACFRVHAHSKGGSGAREHFQADLETARRYTTSPILLGLHRLHNAIIVATYAGLSAKARSREWRAANQAR
jgi:glycosyltransferase involved in cell wall biosynthesis